MGDPLPADAPIVGRSDLLEVSMADALVVFDPASVRAHVLNPSAARIWAMLGAPTSIDDLTRALQADTDGIRGPLERDVRTAIEHFDDQHLLSASPMPSPHPDSSVSDLAGWARCDEAVPGRRSATIAMLDRTIAVVAEGGAEELIDAVDWFAAPTKVREPAAELYRLDLDPAEVRTVPSRLNRLATRSSAFTIVHAAGVVFGDAVVLLAAGAGAGKSTLATRLVLDGAGYLSDEVVGLAPARRGVAGYPKRISLELGSWSLFPELDAIASSSTTHERLDPTRVRWVDPRDLRATALGRGGRTLALGMIVLPKYRAGAAVEFERLAAADAIVDVLAQASNLSLVGARGVETLCDAVQQVPCYRLVHGDARVASMALREVADQAGLVA